WPARRHCPQSRSVGVRALSKPLFRQGGEIVDREASLAPRAVVPQRRQTPVQGGECSRRTPIRPSPRRSWGSGQSTVYVVRWRRPCRVHTAAQDRDIAEAIPWPQSSTCRIRPLSLSLPSTRAFSLLGSAMLQPAGGDPPRNRGENSRWRRRPQRGGEPNRNGPAPVVQQAYWALVFSFAPLRC